jgi:alpha-galactosidase
MSYYRFFVTAALFQMTLAIDNGLASKPGLGWNSDYKCCFSSPLKGYENEAYIKTIADFLVSSGLSDLGYVNVNMDSLWNTAERDSNGDWIPDPTLWPNGLNYTINYVHSVGLKFGLYGDRGTKDCNGMPGNLGHEVQDANFLARYNVDWYKSDSCYAAADPATAFREYGVMRDALNATGHRIWFALCGWNPFYAPVGNTLGNSWRIGEDTGGGWQNVLSNVASMLTLGQYSGPGGWSDMSLLLLPGMGSANGPTQLMTNERHRSQFSLHCIFANNMLMTGNLSALPQYVLDTWGNSEAVKINQDYPYKPFIVQNHTVTRMQKDEKLSYTQAILAECGGEPTLQNWTLSDASHLPSFPPGFLLNSASQQCLNVDNCQTEVIYDGCTIAKGTCSGPNTFKNEQWSFQNGALISLLDPGNLCATVSSANTLSLSTCTSPTSPEQTFSYSASTGQVLGKGGLCLTAPGSPPPPSNEIQTLLISREMSDGSWAMLALNNLNHNATITCDEVCFAKMGFSTNDVVIVRDTFLHETINTTSATSLDVFVAANGTSRLLTLTLQ